MKLYIDDNNSNTSKNNSSNNNSYNANKNNDTKMSLCCKYTVILLHNWYFHANVGI